MSCHNRVTTVTKRIYFSTISSLMDSNAISSLDASQASRLNFEQQDISFLQVLPIGETSFQVFSRLEILNLAKEECINIFGSTTEALRLRDIRVLFPDSTSSDPCFVVRMLSSIVNLRTVRALILPDRLLVVIPSGADEIIHMIRSKMEELSQGIADSNLDLEKFREPEEEEEIGTLQDHEDHPFIIFEESKPTKGLSETDTNPYDEKEPLSTREDKDNLLDNELAQSKRRRESITTALSVLRKEAISNSDKDPVSKKIKPIVESKEVTIVEDDANFELHATETVLWTALKLLEREYNSLKPKILKITKFARTDHSETTLEILRQVRVLTNRLLADSESQVEALTELTENDRDMALLMFSRVLKYPERYREGEPESVWILDHEDVEMLLDSYIQRFDSVINEIRFFIEELELSESNIAVGLDISRNRLLKMNVTVSSVTALSGVGAFIAGIFGMNLNSGIQLVSDPPIFWIVAGISFFGVIIGIVIMIIIASRWL